MVIPRKDTDIPASGCQHGLSDVGSARTWLISVDLSLELPAPFLRRTAKDLPEPWSPVQCSFLLSSSPPQWLPDCSLHILLIKFIPIWATGHPSVSSCARFHMYPSESAFSGLVFWFIMTPRHYNSPVHLIFLAQLQNQPFPPESLFPFLESQAKNKIGVLNVLLLEYLLF